MMNNKPIYAFNHYEDMTNIKDSMELDSGTIIATLKTPEHFASLEVKGKVKVFWDPQGKDPSRGECYRYPSEFCDELKELIKTKKFWDTDERVLVCENNWFELFIGKDENDPMPVSDVVDVEGLTTEEIESLLFDWIEDEKSYEDYNKNDTKEYLIPVEWTVTENISVEAISLEKAIEWARTHADEIPCQSVGEYVDGTWKLCFDNGQSAKELADHLRKYGMNEE